MAKRLVPLLTTVALAVGVSACGASNRSRSSSSAASSSAPGAAGAPAAGSPAVHLLRIAAASGGTLMYTRKSMTTPAGTVEIVFTNDSPIEHNLTLQKGTNGPVLGATPTFSGGSRTLKLTLTPGRYTYYCGVPGHRAAGMFGTLKVS